VERRRDVWDSATGELVSTPLLRWASMQPGERIDGPAVIEHPTTTVVVPGDHRAEVDELGNLILQNGGPA
jgi:N-methylhydantoinase A